MKKEFKVRSYRPGDEAEIVELLQLGFDGWPNFDINCAPLEHWKWKYLDNPLKMNTIAVVISNNKILGCGHGFNVKIKIGEGSIFCHYGCDLTVHPDFRRMGLMKTLREKKKELRDNYNVHLTYRVTSNPIVIKSWDRIGRPRIPQTVINLVRICDIDKQMKSMPVTNAFFKKLGFQLSKLLNDLSNTVHRPYSLKQELNVNQVGRFDERIERFWEEVSKHYDFIVERHRDHLNWRYCDKRAGGFVVKQVEEDGEILGYSVLKINKSRMVYPVGYIVDILALPGRLDVADLLVADAVKYFDKNDINIVNCLLIKNHPYKRIFNRYGFLDSRIKIHLSYTSHGLEDELKDLRTSSKPHFTYGDIDSLPAGNFSR